MLKANVILERERKIERGNQKREEKELTYDELKWNRGQLYNTANNKYNIEIYIFKKKR